MGENICAKNRKQMNTSEILGLLPYQKPFLFVDELLEVDENGARGTYTFSEDEYFYRGHFRDHPVTPGVILTETMAQIGLVCLGLYLVASMGEEANGMAMSSNEISFYLPVYPGEKVTVQSKKDYFRFNKLKCQVEMRNEADQLVCKGYIAGMINTNK